LPLIVRKYNKDAIRRNPSGEVRNYINKESENVLHSQMQHNANLTPTGQVKKGREKREANDRATVQNIQGRLQNAISAAKKHGLDVPPVPPIVLAPPKELRAQRASGKQAAPDNVPKAPDAKQARRERYDRLPGGMAIGLEAKRQTQAAELRAQRAAKPTPTQSVTVEQGGTVATQAAKPSLKEQAAAHREDKGSVISRGNQLLRRLESHTEKRAEKIRSDPRPESDTRRSTRIGRVAETSVARFERIKNLQKRAMPQSNAALDRIRNDVAMRNLQQEAATAAVAKVSRGKTPKSVDALIKLEKQAETAAQQAVSNVGIPRNTTPTQGTRGPLPKSSKPLAFSATSTTPRVMQRIKKQRAEGRGTAERLQAANLLRGVRNAIRNPPAIQGVSQKQVNYAASVRGKQVSGMLNPAHDQKMQSLRHDLQNEQRNGSPQSVSAVQSEIRNHRRITKRQRYDRLLKAGGYAIQNNARSILDGGTMNALDRDKAFQALLERSKAARQRAATPSLKEQAAEHRLKKGTRAERLNAMIGDAKNIAERATMRSEALNNTKEQKEAFRIVMGGAQMRSDHYAGSSMRHKGVSQAARKQAESILDSTRAETSKLGNRAKSAYERIEKLAKAKKTSGQPLTWNEKVEAATKYREINKRNAKRLKTPMNIRVQYGQQP